MRGTRRQYTEFFNSVIWLDMREMMQSELDKYLESLIYFKADTEGAYQLRGEDSAWVRGAMAKLKDFLEMEDSIMEVLQEEEEIEEEDENAES